MVKNEVELLGEKLAKRAKEEKETFNKKVAENKKKAIKEISATMEEVAESIKKLDPEQVEKEAKARRNKLAIGAGVAAGIVGTAIGFYIKNKH
jgi:hypothetical protein